MTVWIYDQGEDLKVFATEEVARKWIDKNDPEGVAFEHEVIGAVELGQPDLQNGPPSS